MNALLLIAAAVAAYWYFSKNQAASTGTTTSETPSAGTGIPVGPYSTNMPILPGVITAESSGAQPAPLQQQQPSFVQTQAAVQQAIVAAAAAPPQVTTEAEANTLIATLAASNPLAVSSTAPPPPAAPVIPIAVIATANDNDLLTMLYNRMKAATTAGQAYTLDVWRSLLSYKSPTYLPHAYEMIVFTSGPGTDSFQPYESSPLTFDQWWAWVRPWILDRTDSMTDLRNAQVAGTLAGLRGLGAMSRWAV